MGKKIDPSRLRGRIGSEECWSVRTLPTLIFYHKIQKHTRGVLSDDT